ncbi:MAG: response regulator [Desulfobacterales bacterium]|nr:response regulator [Desulfobacterales bacterium]
MNMDTDFISIFKTQVQEHIRAVTGLVLELEAAGAGAGGPVLERMMREFHTVKGAARAVDFPEIKDCAHRLEDIYHDLLDGNQAVRMPDLADLTLYGVDRISAMLETRMRGEAPLPAAPFDRAAADYTAGRDLSVRVPEPETDLDTGGTSGSGTGSDRALESRQGPGEYERFTDALLGLSGELAVTVTGVEVHWKTLQKAESEARKLARDLRGLMDALAGGLAGRDNRAVLDRAERMAAVINKGLARRGSAMDALGHTQDRLVFLSGELDRRITNARLIPLSCLFDEYPRMVRDLARELGKECRIEITGGNSRIDRSVLDIIRAPLLHVLRNSVDHGLESPDRREKSGKPSAGTLRLSAADAGDMVRITLADDGPGLDMDGIRKQVIDRGDTTPDLWAEMSPQERHQFLFLPGFTTTDRVTDTSGRGVGLDIAKTEVESIGGTIRIDTTPGQGTAFVLDLPVTLSLTRCLVVAGGRDPFFGTQKFAFPLNQVGRVLRLRKKDLRTLNNRSAIRISGRTLLLHEFADMVDLAPEQTDIEAKHVIVLEDALPRHALLVDNIVDELDIVMHGMDDRLGKVRDIRAVTSLPGGDPALVVDAGDLLVRMNENGFEAVIRDREAEPDDPCQKSSVLVVEDSITVREVERHMLEEAGYNTDTAVDGADGLNKIRIKPYDLVVTDIDMPRMNGIDMIKKIRSMKRMADLPIIVVSYKDREEDREKAMAAGANHYISKASFDSGEMLDIVGEILAK